jgi:hypothetical protein
VAEVVVPVVVAVVGFDAAAVSTAAAVALRASSAPVVAVVVPLKGRGRGALPSDKVALVVEAARGAAVAAEVVVAVGLVGPLERQLARAGPARRPGLEVPGPLLPLPLLPLLLLLLPLCSLSARFGSPVAARHARLEGAQSPAPERRGDVSRKVPAGEERRA